MTDSRRELVERVIEAARTLVNKANYRLSMRDGDSAKGTGNYLADALAALDCYQLDEPAAPQEPLSHIRRGPEAMEPAVAAAHTIQKDDYAKY